MKREDVLQKIQENIRKLDAFNQDADDNYIPLHQKPSPSVDKICEIVEITRAVIFPGFFESISGSMEHYVGVQMDRIYDLLSEQVYCSLCFETSDCSCDTREKASDIAVGFINHIPEIKRLISTDTKAILDADPAAKSICEVIFCYPSVKAIFHHRVAHALLTLGVPLLPRIISEIAHAATGIDIHPGARIGEYFSIDHGTGVVIGETSVIGKHVILYQGVTLGAKNFTYDSNGHPIDIPRHPILEDYVTVYSNTSILGRVTIGKGSVIGGNVWLTQSVPPNSKILQKQADHE